MLASRASYDKASLVKNSIYFTINAENAIHKNKLSYTFMKKKYYCTINNKY